MTLPRTDWIPIVDAVDLLAVRFYDQVASNWVRAYHSAWGAITDSLVDGELPSRPHSTAAFEWTLIDATGVAVRSLHLENDAIPQTFWFHYREASQAHSHGLITLNDGPGAHSAGSNFWFEQRQGIADGQAMRGRVGQVHVHEPSLPKGTKTKGKRGRPRRRQYSDREIEERAVAVIDSGTMTASEAVKRFAPDMEGATLNAKETRLRSRLKEAGRWMK